MSRYNSVTINGVRKLEHVAIWEAKYGPKPEGCEIHHINGNGHDNRLENLVCLSKIEHSRLHAKLRKQHCDVIDSSDPEIIRDHDRKRRWRARHPDKVKAELERNRESRRISHKRWLSENPDKIKLYRKQDYQRHAAHYKEMAKQYALEHPEKVKMWRAMAEERNKEKLQKARKIYRTKNANTLLEKHRQYNDIHRDLIRAKAKYAGEKRKTLHYNQALVDAAAEAVRQAYQKEIELGLRAE